MIKQNNTANFDLESFLVSGAMLQLASDQFKLISGPFQESDLNSLIPDNNEAIVYQPDFWDFLNLKSIPQKGLKGTVSRLMSRSELIKILESTCKSWRLRMCCTVST